MQSILSLFAIEDAKANLGEVSLNGLNIEDEAFDLEAGDEIVIKEIKKR